MDDAERILVVEVARQFYLEDKSKTELAAEHGLSRFKIARLLEQARTEGVVRIEIDDAGLTHRSEAVALQRHLGLQDCIVVPAARTEVDNRRALARAAAAFVIARARDRDVIGFSWGRTLVAIGEHMAALPPATLVQLTGTVGNDVAQSPVEVIRRIAERTRVRTMAVFAPLFAGTEDGATAMRSDPANAATIRMYRDLDLAVLSVGSWEPPITQLAEFFSEPEREELNTAGARAEMAGIFVRDDGSIVDASVARRRISVSVDELLRARRVLAVAGTTEKAPAIMAVARSGLISSLVTDTETAAVLMAMPPVAETALARVGRDE